MCSIWRKLAPRESFIVTSLAMFRGHSFLGTSLSLLRQRALLPIQLPLPEAHYPGHQPEAPPGPEC
eukprot:4645622-Pyramimonas_sp.AAC.1